MSERIVFRDWVREQTIPRKEIEYSVERLKDLNDDLMPSIVGEESIEETHVIIRSKGADFSLIYVIILIFAIAMIRPPILAIPDLIESAELMGIIFELPVLLIWIGLSILFMYESIAPLYGYFNVRLHGKVIVGKICGITYQSIKRAPINYVVLIKTRIGYRWLEVGRGSKFYEKGDIVSMKIYKDWVVIEKNISSNDVL
ncbi:MAG: hypothetical protein K6G88_02380 [Lachnospiraceae bacterium]|nr:hypothetical protein [Lachnospiraceae bacterium]